MASILIVEDVPAVRLSLKIVGDGHRFTCAENGIHSLDLLKTEALDLVVTDIWMPGANGSDVIRKGKAQSPGTRFPGRHRWRSERQWLAR